MATGKHITIEICVNCITLAMCMNRERETVVDCKLLRRAIASVSANLEKNESILMYFEGLNRYMLSQRMDADDLLLISSVDKKGNFLI